MFIKSYVRSKRTIILFAATAGIAAGSNLFAQVDLGLSPMRVDFAAIAGKSYSSILTLTNSGNEKGRVRVELLDLYIDETMTPQFVSKAPAEALYSCRSWLTVNPMELEMEPKSQVSARFTVRTPLTAREQGFHCAIGFRTLPALSDASGSTMLTAVRMIAAIYPTVGTPAISGEIKDLSLEPVPNDPENRWRAVVVMENSGSMLYRPVGDIEVIDSSGHVVESGKLAAFPALPSRKQRYLLPLTMSLAPGQYTVRARIDVGKERQEASRSMTIPYSATPTVAASPKE
jgi:hypothetical protein